MTNTTDIYIIYIYIGDGQQNYLITIYFFNEGTPYYNSAHKFMK